MEIEMAWEIIEKCIDVSLDPSIFTAIEVMENHVEEQKNVNLG